MPIDTSIPRECIPWEGQGDPGPCPRCGAPLKQEYVTYLVLTRQDGKMADSFMAGSDEGWFCTQCPVLLLNSQELTEPLSFGLPKWNVGDESAVVGIVDLNAIPADKANVPIGAPGNPVPLVEFSNLRTPGTARSSRPGRKRSRPKKRHKKRRR